MRSRAELLTQVMLKLSHDAGTAPKIRRFPICRGVGTGGPVAPCSCREKKTTPQATESVRGAAGSQARAASRAESIISL